MQTGRKVFRIVVMLSVGMFALLVAYALRKVLSPPRPQWGMRLKADMRSLATGLESYYVDNGCYPACTFNPQLGANAFAPPGSFPKHFSTFRILTPKDQLLTLTTPTAYVTNYFPDQFSDVKGATFGYYTATESDYTSWILYSPGPDMDYDFAWWDFDPKVPQPSDALLAKYTYDPTNGTISDGDVWRVKQ